MTFLIRESSNRDRQDYSISVYSNGSTCHSRIYRDGSDLMLMSLTFTSLMELVDYFTRKPIFHNQTLRNPAISYKKFIELKREYRLKGLNRNINYIRALNDKIQLKIQTLRTSQFH